MLATAVKMRATKKTSKSCVKCGGEIPSEKRSDAKYCSERCRDSAEKARYCARNPEYVKRQRRLVTEYRHLTIYGHTDYIDDPTLNINDKYRHARAQGYRSGLEVAVARQLEQAGVLALYEPCRFKYEPIKKIRTYVPDYILPNGIVIETKGRFVSADRQKHLAIAEMYPELDLRFVFQNPNAKINKGSKTTYAMWCDKHGFQYAAKVVPMEWILEPACRSRLGAIEQAKQGQGYR